MKFQEKKIRIASPLHYILVQEALFKEGYRWADKTEPNEFHPFFVPNKNPLFLICYEDGLIRFGISESEFNHTKFKEYTYAFEITKEINCRETIEILGNIYYLDEVKSLLSNLKAI